MTALLLRMTSQMTGQSMSEAATLLPADAQFAGLDKEVELAVRFAPSHQAASRAASSLAHMIALHPGVPVRVAGVDMARSRVHLTVAVSLGPLNQIKVAGPRPCESVAFIRALVKCMAAFDPAFVQVPDPESLEAIQARDIQLGAGANVHVPTLVDPARRSA